MKILLVGVNSKFIHSNPALFYLREYVLRKLLSCETGKSSCGMTQEPSCETGKSSCGMTDITRWTREFLEKTIEIREYTINREPGTTVADIYEAQPDVIAVSCYIWNISYVSVICDSLHKVLPGTDIWLGGPEVTHAPESVFEKMPFLRGIMAGEGEKSFQKLVEAYLKGERETLPRILASELLNLDDVPFPYTDLSQFENRIVYYETSRGCPFSCSYCLSSVDRRVRLRSLSLVYNELQRFLDANVPLVKFVDRTFNCNREHTEGILKYIKEHDNGITEFHFEIAAELLTDDQLELISSLRPGQIQLEIGVQTTNPETLAAIHRKSDPARLSDIVAKILKANRCHVHLDLIAGLPHENLASFRRSFNDVYAMGAHNLQLGFLKVLKGTDIAERAAEYGIVSETEPPYEVLATKWLSFSDILELKGVESVLEIYGNSLQFINTLRFAIPFFSDAYTFFLELSRFYAENGYDKISLSRYERYSVLRDFLIGKLCKNGKENVGKISGNTGDIPVETAEDTERIRQDITENILHDLYLRDNIKSRPEYGADGMPEKEKVHAFFESQEFRRFLPAYGAYTPQQAARMTHIEKRRDGFCLYDYSERDPITGNCRCIRLEDF